LKFLLIGFPSKAIGDVRKCFSEDSNYLIPDLIPGIHIYGFENISIYIPIFAVFISVKSYFFFKIKSL